MRRLEQRIQGFYTRTAQDGVIDSLRAWRSSRLLETFEGLSNVYGRGWGNAKRGYGSGEDADILIDGYAAGVFLHLPHAQEQLVRLQGLRGRIEAHAFDATHLPLERLSSYIDDFSRTVELAETYASTYRDAVNERSGSVRDRYAGDEGAALLDLHMRSLPEDAYFRFQDFSWRLFEGMIRNDLLYVASPDAAYSTDAYFVEGFFRSNAFIKESEEVLEHLKFFHELQARYDVMESYASLSGK